MLSPEDFSHANAWSYSNIAGFIEKCEQGEMRTHDPKYLEDLLRDVLKALRYRYDEAVVTKKELERIKADLPKAVWKTIEVQLHHMTKDEAVKKVLGG